MDLSKVPCQKASTKNGNSNKCPDDIQNTLSEQINCLLSHNNLNAWKQSIHIPDSKLTLPYFKSNKEGKGTHSFVILKNELDQQIFQKKNLLPIDFFLSIYGFMIGKYARSKEFCIAYPINRNFGGELIPVIQKNCSLIPFHIEGDSTISELIQSHLDYFQKSKVTDDSSFLDLPINTFFENFDTTLLNVAFSPVNLTELDLSTGEADTTQQEMTKHPLQGFELILDYSEQKENWSFTFNYDKSLFSEWFIEQFANEFTALIATYSLPENLQTKLSEISILTEGEHQKVVIDWNNTGKPYPNDKTIYQLFEEQVHKTPDAIAAEYLGSQLTYFELNEKANQFARFLSTQQPITPDTLIALCLDRSLEMIICILGVMKAGGAYVPIAPDYPAERISYILTDIQTKLLITQSHLVKQLKELTDLTPISADTIDYSKLSKENLPTQNKANDLAYVIYTSGTTGNPKGAVVVHQLLVNRLIWQKEQYGFDKSDSILQKTPYVFDVSVWELLLPLISGSKLLFAKVDGHKDPHYLHQTLENDKVTKLHFVPSMLSAFYEYLKSNQIKVLSHVKQVFCSGEALPLQLAQDFKTAFPSIKLNNLYGPTEVAIDVSSYDDIQTSTELIHIGKPIQNISFYVLDEYNNPLPIGAEGELCIGGGDISRGYLNRPELNAEKFIENPFNRYKGTPQIPAKLYKTGDLVRWLPDGNVEYIGRNDFQVKIRGFRIELGEIENRLTEIEDVTQACILAKEKNGTKYLVAYYVSEVNSTITEGFISKELAKKLPEYMVPGVMVKLESFPLTINGKLDRRALPEPIFTSEKSYVAPTSDIEIQLCSIWEQVLNIDTIGVNDDFFRIGGDSILIIQLSSRLRKNGLFCSVKDIFDNRTIKQLANFILSDAEKVEVIAEQGILEGSFGLLPIQRRFFDQVENKELSRYNHWNQSFLAKVPVLKIDRLQEIVAQLTEQHDILRVSFKNGEQAYSPTIEIPEITVFTVEGKTDAEITDQLTDWQSHFNIHEGPLWTVAYLEGYKDKSARLYFALHHLIIDAVSWRILIDDFKTLYTNEALENKTTSYRQWVDAVALYPENHPTEHIYWDHILNRLPISNTPKKEVTIGAVDLRKTDTTYLLQNANNAYHTEVNDLLLTALSMTLHDWNHQTSHAILLEGHGREPINETIDHSKTVGWFTIMYPVILEAQNNLETHITSIKEGLREIPNKGIGFGAIYPEELVNLPEISFNYLGQFDSQDDYWQVVSENSGTEVHSENTDTTVINITGMVVDGILTFHIVSKLGEQETIQFTENFQTRLENVITHCKERIDSKESRYTPSDFETINISTSLLNTFQDQQPIEAIYPANSLQQGFIYHAVSQKEDDAYLGQFLYSYKEIVDIENYISAWKLAVRKYPILRTAFNWEEELIQIVYPEAELNCQVHDLTHLSPKEISLQIEQIQQADRKNTFDLTVPCLLRLNIIKHSTQHYTIIKSEHHSILDGWSGPMLLDTVHDFYDELQAKNTINFIPDDCYLNTQKHLYKQQASATSFWSKKVEQIEKVNELTSLFSNKYEVGSVKPLTDAYDTSIKIPRELFERLTTSTQKEGFTLNSIVQFAWHKLIQIYTQDDQTIVGTTVSGRAIPVTGIEKSVGLFINTLPLVIDWDNNNTVLQQIQYIHGLTTSLNTHSSGNLAELQKEGKRLFHSILVHESYSELQQATKENPARLTPTIEASIEKLDYPLGISIVERGDQLILTLKSDKSILTPQKANDNLNRIQLILEASINNLHAPHTEISVIDPLEYQTIISEWNQTEAPYSKEKTSYQLFEEQVIKSPDSIAISSSEGVLTYTELNAKANCLARYIQSQTKINPNTILALYVDRGIDMVVGMLGIMKAGAAYVPIAPAFPAERVEYILGDTKTAFVLTQSHLSENLREISSIDSLNLDDEEYLAEESTNLIVQNTSSDLAYVLYTSGTTGKPKGVMIEHRALNNLTANVAEGFGIYEGAKVVQLAANVFDASVLETFVTLVNGAELCIVSNEIKHDVNLLREFLKREQINVAIIPPSLLGAMEYTALPVLETIIVAGETCSKEIMNEWSVGRRLINAYGPTEYTVCATLHSYNSNSFHTNIGTPIGNTQAYVLDRNRSPLPIGVEGELYLGGASIARGYLNLPELTKEKFIPNPFVTAQSSNNKFDRLYKTGDLVRWLPNGQLEYIGRNDFQVKIRGHRIELGEIESTFSTFNGIKQIKVLAKENKEGKHLIAYYVSDTEIKENLLIEHLEKALPDYMIPSAFIRMDSFPLTISGKLDINAFPEPTFKSVETYIAPSTELEIKLTGIWKQVLKIEEIGINDNFFRLGGNSILAIQLSHKMSKALDKQISVAEIFNFKTISQLSEFISSNTTGAINITAEKHKDYPLSFAQERLWFIEQFEEGTNAYHIPILTELNSETDQTKLIDAIQQVIERHEVLRTCFIDQNGKYIQTATNEPLKIKKLEGTEIELSAQIARDINTPFDLQNEGPIRVFLYHSENKSNLLINIHHIAADGWSVDILLKEINALYQGKVLSDLTIQYRDFAHWQRNYLQQEVLSSQQDYWKEKLEGFQALELPTDKARPKQVSYSGDHVSFTLTKELSQELRSFSQEQSSTLYATLLSGFYILMSKYTSQNDIVLGTAIANRHYVQTQDLIGFFVNSLVLREVIDPTSSVIDLLNQVQNSLIDAQQYQDIPFEKIVDTQNIEQDSSRHPIFQVMFDVQSFGTRLNNELFTSVSTKDIYTIAKHDLSCFMDDSNEQIQGMFNFATSLFEKSTIERMVNHYLLVLAQIIADQKKSVANYSLVSPAEYQQIALDWNDTSTNYPKEQTIHARFEQVVEASPNQIAIVFEGTEVSYAELNEKANQLARSLQVHSEISPDTFIALCFDRSLEMVISILAVLKTGGTYVPLDPNFPAERINYILNDTNAEILLTQAHLRENLAQITTVECLVLNEQIYSEQDSSNLSHKNNGKDLAYVIYTSGTTGNPKGVMVDHTSVVNFAVDNNYVDHEQVQTVAGLSSFVFDGSIFDLFMPILSGKKHFMLSKSDVTNLDLLSSTIIESEIDTAFFTTALLNSIVENKIELFAHLKQVLFGGESCNLKNINTLRATYPELIINHVYGPTETIVYSTVCKLNELSYNHIAPIGKPINNKKHYVLDSNLNLCPVGVIGELHIGGAGISRGYLNQPELTKKQFIPNPFASDEDRAKGYNRLYKSGDLVRWLADGNIEYIGRNDFQVKIRGYRIELGEIEYALSEIENIQKACVLTKTKNDSKYIIAYIITTDGNKVVIDELRRQLSELIPDYMIPSAFVQLEEIPLTINGKVNRKALPEPEFTNEDGYIEPSTALEIKLASIWQDVLNLEKIGINDDFFRIGGDSILSIQLSSKLRKQNINCSVKALFDHRTISQLATYVLSEVEKVEISSEQGLLEGTFGLLPIQSWFIDKIERKEFTSYNHWNQSFLVKVPELNLEKLKEVILDITKQHDVLRLQFKGRTQSYQSTIALPETPRFSIKATSKQRIHEQLTEWQNNFDIQEGPLWKIAYLEGYEDNSARLFFAFHHLIIDSVSWRILIDDVQSLYANEVLEKKTSSYRQWVNEITSYEENHYEERVYWEDLLQSLPANISTKHPIASEALTLDVDLTNDLLHHSNQAYHTEVNDLLLTALGFSLQQWSQQSLNAITLEGHGREQINETIDHSKTVGWFTTMYPVNLEVQKDDIPTSIKSIKENLRAIPNKGIGFGAMYPNQLTQLPNISFNYLGQFDSQDEYWQIVSEDTGVFVDEKNVDTNIININGMVVEGTLQFSIRTRLGAEETTALTQNFQHHLKEIIAHCKTKTAKNEITHTPSDFKTVSISQSLLDRLQENATIEGIYAANSLQQGFIYHALTQPDDQAYRIQVAFEYNQALNIEHYIESWKHAVSKHPILRTAFNWEEELIQVVYNQADLNWKLHNISHLSEQQQSEYVHELQEKDLSIEFDLTTPCLLRIHLIQHTEEKFTLLKSEHHSISDGWSEPILLNTIHKNYTNLRQQKPVNKIVDDSYLIAQEYIAKHKSNVDNYWKEKVQNIVTINDLNVLLSQKQDLDAVKSVEKAYNTSINITGHTFNVLKSLTKSTGLTINTIVQFAWHKLIQIYTQDQQTIVGTTISGRAIPVNGIEDSVGLYINTLPLIIDWDNENTVLEQIEYIHQEITALNSHSFGNLATLQEDGKRLFHSLFVFENYPTPEENGDSDSDQLIPEFKFAVEKVDYPLALNVHEQVDKLVIQLKSGSDLLELEKAQYNLGKIELLITSLLASLDQKHSTLTTVTEAEYQQIAIDWNDTTALYQKDKTLDKLFEQQVTNHPEEIAVSTKNQSITYSELNNQSNQLANHLKASHSVGDDGYIGLFMEPGIEMIVGILGTLKAGAAYVPIDPEYPTDRIQYILKDTQAKCVLTQTHLLETLNSITDTPSIPLDQKTYQNEATTNLSTTKTSDSSAYIIYTSGTTGKPKGVVVPHQGVVNLLHQFSTIKPLESTDNCSAWTNISFDVSVYEIFSPLLVGATLYPVPTDIRMDSSTYLSWIQEHKITSTYVPPFFLNEYRDFLLKEKYSMNRLLVGVEPIDLSLLQEIKSVFTDGAVINGYGPSEGTICSTLYEVEAKSSLESLKTPLTPIGIPVNNTQVYLLDPKGLIVPKGVSGELCIAGDGLANEYLNQAEITADRFVENPFNPGTRMYKTGDLARWRQDGNIEFIGRNDFQIKIRGYRVELGEIESTLTALESVHQTCVIAREKNGQKYLAAYFVAEKEIKTTDLVVELGKDLPEYMIPAAFIQLDRFPLTLNGKIDRTQLPDPQFISEDSYLAPTTALEQELCTIWEEVLNLEKIGITDDFFRIGGDSILSIQLSSKLRKQNIHCSVGVLFEHRTIEQLAQFLVSNTETTTVIAEQGPLEGTFDLLPIQQWFMEQADNKQFPDFNHWNQSFLVKVPELDCEKLQSTIAAITHQHDMLSATFERNKQAYSLEKNIPVLKQLNIQHRSTEEIQALLTEWQCYFNFQHGPLWSVAYLSGYEDGSARLFFAFHHLIIDVVSWRIIIEDVKSLYYQEVLENKTSSYRQWVDEISGYEEAHSLERNYWEQALATLPNYPRTKNEAISTSLTINARITNDLLKHANQAYHTEINDLLITALGLSLQEWNQLPTHGITLEAHGRENLNTTIDHSRTVGWFTTIYPLRLNIKDDIDSAIKTIKEEIRSIPNKGVGFGAIFRDKLVELPNISFNYLGQFDQKDEFWQVLSENAGTSVSDRNKNTSLLSVVGRISENELSFDLTSRLGHTETKAFKYHFQEKLELVIEHCKTKLKNNKIQHTPSDFGHLKISQSLLDRLEGKAPIEAIYHANSLQQGFIFHALSQKDDQAYRVQLALDYNQTLNIENYHRAWELAIAQYPILRTAFNWEEELIQIVHQKAELKSKFHDITHLLPQQQEKYIAQLQKDDLSTAFDLTVPGLLRIHVVKKSEQQFTIIKSEHHSISDGWSQPILLNSVHEFYKQLQGQQTITIRPETSYLAAQKYIADQKTTVDTYWKQKVESIENTNQLSPLLSGKQNLDSVKSLSDPVSTSIEIKGSCYDELKALTKSTGLTINTLVQFAWHKLIQVYTQDKQTVVGTTISGRTLPVHGIEESVGLYINTLPLIINWDNQNTVIEQIEYIHTEITALNSNSFGNLADLQEEGNRLFHSILVFENYPTPQNTSSENKDQLSPKFRDVTEQLDYPIGLIIQEFNDKLIIQLKSDNKLITKDKATEQLSKVRFLLTSILEHLDHKHNDLSTLSNEEYQRVILDWNAVEVDHQTETTFHRLFEEQVVKTPNKVALFFENQEVTYADVNAKANQLARHIQTQTEISSNTLIVLCLDRSIEMIISILAVMKTGAAYVPIDPAYPAGRIQYILEDTETELILTQKQYHEKLITNHDITILEVDSHAHINQDDNNLSVQPKMNDLAYVIYTSGTTGNPKGVMIAHDSMMNVLMSMQNKYPLSENDSYLLKTNYCFDVSVSELFGWSLSGGSLVILPKGEEKEPLKILQKITEHKVTHVNFVPSMFTGFLAELSELEIDLINSLKYIFLAGEALSVEAVNDFKSLNTNIQLENIYGPTEGTIYSTWYSTKELNGATNVPIGKPLDNVKLYVLDDNNHPQTAGAIGELCIAGAGLAKGYLNQPKLSAEKFIQNPFITENDRKKGHTKLYKTGDLVRWLPDGNIEYIERKDFQVKLRGYRIELGEVENALTQIKGIKQAAAIVGKNNQSQYLAAYFIPEKETEILQEEVISALSRQLPEYMIPNILVPLESFPLTSSGKLNKKELPNPVYTNTDTYLPPSTELEEQICAIWQDVLNIERIGINDNFFRIGGNSISAIKLSHKLRKEVDTTLSVADIFNHKTIQELSNYTSSLIPNEEYIEIEL